MAGGVSLMYEANLAFQGRDGREWRRFQADLQTAVVVANDIKVEAQQGCAPCEEAAGGEEKNARLQKAPGCRPAAGGSRPLSSPGCGGVSAL